MGALGYGTTASIKFGKMRKASIKPGKTKTFR